VQGDEIEFHENDRGEIQIPNNIRQEVLEAFFAVFEHR
jgi:hypothetical protein